MVSEIRAALPKPQPFNWEREYGPLWTGDDCTAFWLAPGPDDYITIDGIRAPLREHQSGKAKHDPQWLCAGCGETEVHYMLNKTLCYACDAAETNAMPDHRVRMKVWEHRKATSQRICQITGMDAAQAQNYYQQAQLQNGLQQALNPLALMGIGWPSRKGTKQ